MFVRFVCDLMCDVVCFALFLCCVFVCGLFLFDVFLRFVCDLLCGVGVLCEIYYVMLHGVLYVVCLVFVCFVSIMFNMSVCWGFTA